MLESGAIKGLAHITGGGLVENIPRVLPEGAAAEIKAGSWPVLPVFNLLSRIGNVPELEMYRTFNMGIGMVLISGAEESNVVREDLNQRGEAHYEIGRVVAGSRSVSILT